MEKASNVQIISFYAQTLQQVQSLAELRQNYGQRMHIRLGGGGGRKGGRERGRYIYTFCLQIPDAKLRNCLRKAIFTTAFKCIYCTCVINGIYTAKVRGTALKNVALDLTKKSLQLSLYM